MSHPTFSVLLATVDRTAEVRKFLRSLGSQTCRDFELLVVDQNTDSRVAEVLSEYEGQFPIRRIPSKRGHSRAFNIGITHASGEVLAFPDDDCWYDPNLLERVAKLLLRHREASGITGREIAEPGFVCGGRWDSSPGLVTRANVFRRAISFTMFLRRAVALRYPFDETLGVGADTPWGAGEETDYLLNLIHHGHTLWFDPSIGVWHQGRSGPFTPQICAKARSYGMGMGRVLRKNGFSRWTVARYVARPAAGAMLSLAAANLPKARYHWSICAGRAAGWRLTPEVWAAHRDSPARPVPSQAAALMTTRREPAP